MKKVMKYCVKLSITVGVILSLALLITSLTSGAGNLNPSILPPNSKPYGKTYGEWGAEWWKWAVGIPAAENPILDTTGEFSDIDQDGPVWFIAGAFGGTYEREITVPRGKALFFPLVNALWWAPDDLETARYVVEVYLGLNPDDFTDEELIRLLANFFLCCNLEMTCCIDGQEIQNLEGYHADSRFFHIEDTDLIDDLGGSIAEDNLAVAAGYWLMVAPLSAGEHVIHFTASLYNDLAGEFDLDMTILLTME